MAGAIMSAGSDCWGTPQALFDALNREFRFELDAAADETNHKVEVWLGPGGMREDALATDWVNHYGDQKAAKVFLNLPFSKGPAFIAKAVEQAARGCLVVCLLPANKTEQPWWHELVLPFADEKREIRGRLTYEREGGSVGATFPSCVVIFRPRLIPHGAMRTFSADRRGQIVQPAPKQLELAA